MLKYVVICTVLHCVNAPYQYTRDEKIFCVAEYLRNNECMISTEGALQRKYGFRPTPNTISRLVNNFSTYGNVEKPREERTMTARTQHIIGIVEEMVIEATENGEVISVRRVARELGITNSTANLILKKDHNFHSYHPITIHHLNEDNPEVRIEFSRLFLDMQNKDEEFMDKITWSDESLFSVNGYVNRHNTVYWSPSNPNIVLEQDKLGETVMVWAGI